jgi:D-alanyl-D-alanine carboxypeptidase/D-alanyl-D-alanine-endopeptidase (penicillin-binding protein 4)
VSLFPVAGKTGTVKSFMLNTRLSGKLVLKTGSMNGVQCYAGYKIDDNGKPTHVVVIMANSFFGTRADLRAAISNLLLNNL